MIIKNLFLVAAPVSIVLLGACAREQNMEPVAITHSSASDARVANADAVAELSNAWCNRAERCELIGAGKEYADRAKCESAAQKDTASDFLGAECRGVKKPQLTQCASDVTRLGCTLNREGVMTLTSCRGHELCK